MSLVAAPNKGRLNSWKEIAAYFGNDQRTVKRWESTRGLPVRRLPGARSGVYALVSEIEAWQRGETVTIRQIDLDGTESEAPSPDGSLHLQFEAERPGDPDDASDEGAATSSELESRSTTGPASAHAQADTAKTASTIPSAHRFSQLWQFSWLLLATAACAAAAALVWHFHAKAAAKVARHVPPARARELYLQGRFLWDKRTPEALKASLVDFEEATRIDPQYAAAYAGIADCYALSPEFAPRPSTEVYPRMLAAAQRALALDSTLAEGHRARGFALFYWNLDRKGSRAEFERALAIAPNDATTHLWFANTLASSGRWNEALAEIERAREINPTAAPIVVDRAWILYGANHTDEAMQIWKGLAQTDAGYTMVHVWMAEHYLNEHEPEEYLRQLEIIARLRNTEVDRTRFQLARHAFESGGEPAMRQALARYEQELYRRGEAPAFTVAVAMMRAGERDAAMDYLETAYRTRDDFTPGLNLRREFMPLHGTPRFERLVAESEVPFPETANTEVAAASPR